MEVEERVRGARRISHRGLLRTTEEIDHLII